MTTEAKARLARYRSGDTLPSYDSPYILINDLEAESEAIKGYCKANCHSGSSPGKHEACLEILQIMGERPEGEVSK